MTRVQLVFGAAIGVLAVGVGAGQGPGALTSDALMGLELRSLGPMLETGRVADIAVDPKNPSVYYVAAAAGGLWKTENRGTTWTSVFDHGGSFNMCCVVVDPRDSSVVWLATGENSNPRSSMYGDGLYKSADAGKTWTRVGLEKSEHLGRVVIDPRNSNVVYVAAQGPLWSAGGDRGVYKTTDGGATWKAVLTVSPDTGGNDLVMDPNNPDILYASTWQRRRGVGQMIGGGPESAIFKTTNAGAAWTKLAKGLPTGDMGRIALGVDPKAKPTRVYALVNALGNSTGFYRSDDAGATWARVGKEAPSGRGGRGGAPAAPPDPQSCSSRGGEYYCGGDPGYYYELFVDPVRPDTIWSANTQLEWSQDGGKTFQQVPNMNSVHVDFHAVWVDPTNKNHVLVGNDGGAYETWDMQHWRHFAQLPVTQFYRVGVDDAKPFYHVCGGAQDNESLCGPSRSQARVGIRTSEWWATGGCDGFQARVDPDDPNIVYTSCQQGGISRMDLRTGVSKGIQPRPPAPPAVQTPPAQAGGGAAGAAGAGGGAGAAGAAGGGRGGRGGDRVNWDAPYIISPHSPTRLYWGSNFLYRTDDRGDTWTRISPDLTRNLDFRVIPIMGKVWDPTTTVAYNNATTTLSDIVTIGESPLLDGLLYVGTDDGLLQVTEDGGKTWRKTEQFANVPGGVYVTCVFASPRDANVVFVALNNWQRGDFKPYLVKSTDRGRTFTSIAGDLPDRNDVWSVVQDHVNGNLMFAGTEFGLFVTLDGGSHWVQLKGGLPTAQVRDLAIQKRENDLVLATFGRGFFVLDDYSALREMNAQTLGQDVELYPLRNAYQYTEWGYTQAAWGNETTPNPPMAAFTYSVGSSFTGKLALTITDDTGKQVRRIDVPESAGLHRVAWNLRGDPAPPAGGRGGGGAAPPPAGGGGFGGRGGGGPAIEPGHYTVTLGKVSGETVTAVGTPRGFLVLPLPAKNY
jgi:photosystem II stability/assembly factor-like uncharacterized protein